MAWDNQRSMLLEVPLKQPTTFIDASTPLDASRAVWALLGLHSDDPQHPWVLDSKRGTDLSGSEQAVVVVLTDWPDKARIQRLHDFAMRGGNVVLLLQPGLEQSWEKLPAEVRSALGELLPGSVSPSIERRRGRGDGSLRAGAAAQRAEPMIEDMLESLRREPPTIRRFVPFAASDDPSVSTLLYLAAKNEDARSAQFGLWYRRESSGAAPLFTLSSLPAGARYMTPGVPWIYPMAVIKSCMRPPNRGDAQNVEVGQAGRAGAGGASGGEAGRHSDRHAQGRGRTSITRTARRAGRSSWMRRAGG